MLFSLDPIDKYAFLAHAGAVSADQKVDASCQIVAAEYRRYALPLKQAVTTGAEDKTREGLIVEIRAKSPQGKAVSGRGEIAPLPGDSPENASLCLCK